MKSTSSLASVFLWVLSVLCFRNGDIQKACRRGLLMPLEIKYSSSTSSASTIDMAIPIILYLDISCIISSEKRRLDILYYDVYTPNTGGGTNWDPTKMACCTVHRRSHDLITWSVTYLHGLKYTDEGIRMNIYSGSHFTRVYKVRMTDENRRMKANGWQNIVEPN